MAPSGFRCSWSMRRWMLFVFSKRRIEVASLAKVAVRHAGEFLRMRLAASRRPT